MNDDYPQDLEPWQVDIVKNFAKGGPYPVTGKTSYHLAAMQSLMDDLIEKPLTDLICNTGTIFGKRFHTVEPVGGNWPMMEMWASTNFGPSSDVWDSFETGMGGRWYMNDRKFWFRDQADLNWFILKWR
jgi:hypothetical protein